MKINTSSKVFSIMLVAFMLASCVTFITPIMAVEANASGTTYYINFISGKDSNSGTAENSAWKTLNKVNSTTFLAGDRILFKSGCSWNGQLSPKGSGLNGSPIIIDMYGGKYKPIINGGGITKGGTVTLLNVEYWEINNLEVTNDDNFLKEDITSDRKGIYVLINNDVICNHIYIMNCYVHDVDGDSEDHNMGGGNQENGGIIFEEQEDKGARFNDILIEGNSIRKVDKTGITACCASYKQNVETKHTNVVVRNNYLNDIGGDGIIMKYCISGLVEYNVLNSGACRSQAVNDGMWAWGCIDATIQYNEVYLMHGNKDGEGFDSDWMSDGTIIQYNYSHDNEGGFCLVCCPGIGGNLFNTNSILRYNISQNDGTRTILLMGAGTQNTKIYNNTFLCGYAAKTIMYSSNYGGEPGDTYINNNIFYMQHPYSTFNTPPSFHYDYNAYFGSDYKATDEHKITTNPKFTKVGSGGIGRNTVDGYRLKSGSPCIGSGMVISDNGGKDYWGNALYNGNPDIGAYEYPVGPTTTPRPSPNIKPTPIAVSNPTSPKVSPVTHNDKTLRGQAQFGTVIKIQAGSKTYATTTKTNKTFSAAITKQKTGTKISVTAIDMSGHKSKATVVVVK